MVFRARYKKSHFAITTVLLRCCIVQKIAATVRDNVCSRACKYGVAYITKRYACACREARQSGDTEVNWRIPAVIIQKQ